MRRGLGRRHFGVPSAGFAGSAGLTAAPPLEIWEVMHLVGPSPIHVLLGTRRGWLTPRINRATAQPIVADQLLGCGENLAVIWQCISNNEPRRPPLAIFQILEETGIDGLRHAA